MQDGVHRARAAQAIDEARVDAFLREKALHDSHVVVTIGTGCTDGFQDEGGHGIESFTEFMSVSLSLSLARRSVLIG
jgi:hypothetical protein